MIHKAVPKGFTDPPVPRPDGKGGVGMLVWLSTNLINIALILAVALIVFLIVRAMIRDRRAGRTSCGSCSSTCGGGCAGCPMAGYCHRGAAVKKK